MLTAQNKSITAACLKCFCALGKDFRRNGVLTAQCKNIITYSVSLCFYRPTGLNVSQANCRLAKAWQAKGNIAVGLAVVQSQLQQDPAHQALDTLQVRFIPCGLHPINCILFFCFIPYSLGCGATCDSSDILA